MHDPLRDLPDRMIALSILPPPPPWRPPAPFGFGALVVTPGRAGAVRFDAHAHGYAAGYDPRRLQTDIARLFTPETSALTFVLEADAHRAVGTAYARPVEHIWDQLPRSGTQLNTQVTLGHDVLVHAAAIGGVILPEPTTTPLARLHRIGAEAQAIWLYWLLMRDNPRARRQLLAGFQAWRAIELAGGGLAGAG